MRLDHFLLSTTVRDRLVLGGVDRWVRGEENASDHAPAWIVLESLSCSAILDTKPVLA
jgi:exodeoxyribonuclease-3